MFQQSGHNRHCARRVHSHRIEVDDAIETAEKIGILSSDASPRGRTQSAVPLASPTARVPMAAIGLGNLVHRARIDAFVSFWP